MLIQHIEEIFKGASSSRSGNHSDIFPIYAIVDERRKHEHITAGKDWDELGLEDLKAVKICDAPQTVMCKVRAYDSGSIVSPDFGCCAETARSSICTNIGQHAYDTQEEDTYRRVKAYLTGELAERLGASDST